MRVAHSCIESLSIDSCCIETVDVESPHPMVALHESGLTFVAMKVVALKVVALKVVALKASVLKVSAVKVCALKAIALNASLF